MKSNQVVVEDNLNSIQVNIRKRMIANLIFKIEMIMILINKRISDN